MTALDAPMPEIRALERPGDFDIALLTDRQHGVVAHWQLIRLGLGGGAIQHRVKRGYLHRLHKGVYAVGRKSVSRKGRWMAAVLGCGPDAVLSHRSAAALWGLVREPGSTIDVTVPGRTRHGRGAIAVHNVRLLHRDERLTRDYIPVTSLARTLLDFAEVASPAQLARAIDEAERLGLFNLRAIDELCHRSRGRRGVRPLRKAIQRYRESPPMTRSELERRFARICDDAGLPRPAMNLWVAGYEVDASWLDHGLVVEVDSYEFHRTRAAFEIDRARDARLQREGLRVMRVTDTRIVRDPAAVGRDIKALLAPARLIR